ncbi:MAG: TldD/PmbA family protein [bacterium]|nr:TldD/PmbA family protein [bacterium]
MKIPVQEAPAFLVEEVRRRGAGDAEAFLEVARETKLQVSRGQVEELTHAEQAGVGLRILLNGATGFSYAADFDRASLEALVDRALGAARIATPDEYAALPEVSPAAGVTGLWDPVLAALDVEDKIRFALEQEQSCLDQDPRVNSVILCRYEDAVTRTRIVNSRGLDSEYTDTACGAFAICTARGEGKGTMGVGQAQERFFRAVEGRAIGRQAARKALIALEGMPPPTEVLTVVFEPEAAFSFLAAVVSALSAERAQLGQSMFAGRLGQAVAAPGVDLIDDGLLPGRPGTLPVDGEGVPRRRTTLIAGGVLRSFFHNVRSARKDGVVSTGNARRSGYRALPQLAPSNAFMVPGTASPGELVRAVERGVHVVAFTDTGGVSGLSGDFSVAASGRRITRGELAECLDPFTIGGNLQAMLQQISGVGNDLTWVGSLGSPTIRIEGLTMAGKS